MHLVVTGIPASGKSTLGRALSESLALEMLDKDQILEELFEERGVGDVLWRTHLSRTADQILQERALCCESSVIVSWWRHPASTSDSGTPIEWLSELRGKLIEVYCICDPVIAVERFKSRTRHRGHLDQLKSDADLLPAFQQHAALGPLGVGALLRVKTEGNVKLDEVLSQIHSRSSCK